MSKKVVNGKIPFTTFKIINYYKKDSIYYLQYRVSRPNELCECDWSGQQASIFIKGRPRHQGIKIIYILLYLMLKKYQKGLS